MKLQLILHKFKWEFWPMWLSNIPVGLFWLYFSLRAKNLFFFSTVNPLFENGAMLGASKSGILNTLPAEHIPITLLLKKDENDFDLTLKKMKDNGLSFPVILKPDVGERGLLVELIKNEAELHQYLTANNITLLLQEFVDYPLEAGIFYYRYPDQKTGVIPSIALKEYLEIEGDGSSTCRTLLLKNIHGAFQVDRLEREGDFDLEQIIDDGKRLLIEPIGNHCRGTKVSDGNHLIDQQLLNLFDRLNKDMDQVYYGRFDIKFNSWEELLKGEHFKILELNGIASEPMHIYDERIPIIKKYQSFYSLWNVIYGISKVQRKKGVVPITLSQAIGYIKTYSKYLRSLNKKWRVIPS